MYKKSRLLIGLLTICVVTSSSFVIHSYSTKKQIMALGYNEKETTKFVSKHGIFNVNSKVVSKLENEIASKEKILSSEIGVSHTLIQNYDQLTKVEYNKALDSFIDNTTSLYKDSIKEVDKKILSLKIDEKVDTKNTTLYEELSIKNNLVNDLESEYLIKISELKKKLNNYVMRDSEIELISNNNVIDTYNILTKKYEYFKEYHELYDNSKNSIASGSMDLFNILNKHRIANGLNPFKYNSSQQSCVDTEANSYANNKNPHNWLCKSLTSEGASLAGINSNYIQIAGNFLTTNASHEADVINPNYTSAACSAVSRDGMVYMICGYFR
ncbi:MAG: hypothetical protein ACK5NF_02090 [Bacilli bacterium]